jgi:hypothetical protein
LLSDGGAAIRFKMLNVRGKMPLPQIPFEANERKSLLLKKWEWLPATKRMRRV